MSNEAFSESEILQIENATIHNVEDSTQLIQAIPSVITATELVEDVPSKKEENIKIKKKEIINVTVAATKRYNFLVAGPSGSGKKKQHSLYCFLRNLKEIYYLFF